jgi:DNA polymerase-3 subunit epsilon
MSRFVVFDQETTGLDPRKDHIVSIGAVAVADGGISLDDVFEAVIQTAEITPAVLIHGITPAESRSGVTEAEAVEKFLAFIGDSILVGHHVGFDRAILLAAAGRAGRKVHFEALDTMRLTLALVERQLLAFDAGQGFSLDALCELFHIPPHGRHTAPGDAFLTAQVFVRLLRLCERHGIDPLSFLEPNEET